MNYDYLLFFGSIQNFNAKFDVKTDPDKIEIDFIESRVSDHSGVEAVTILAEKYLELGKNYLELKRYQDAENNFVKVLPYRRITRLLQKKLLQYAFSHT